MDAKEAEILIDIVGGLILIVSIIISTSNQ
jgi:hypothetical protein